MRNTSCVSVSESEEVGSSKIRRLEPCWMARQISTICLPAGLSLSTRQRGLERETVFVDNSLGAFEHRAAIHPAERKARFASEEDVFRDREVRGQHGFLMNHRDTLGGGFGGTAKVYAAALPEHFAAVAFEHAGDDFH